MPVSDEEEARLVRLYDAYVDTYRDATGELSDMMALKRCHTAKVVENARAIAAGEHFTPEETRAARDAALLHDTGRYEQLRRFNTFRDADSVDHAVFSHDIVRDLGWLAARPDRQAILDAVLFHNRRDLPKGLDPFTERIASTVRDADKLDIFRVLEELAGEEAEVPNDSRAFWNLDPRAAPNPIVADCIRRGQPVDYQNIKSLSDFILIQVGWMTSGLVFATSRRLCAERGHLAYRRRLLHRLTESPETDKICDLAERMLSA